jgi:hypothetical protein
MVIICNMQLLKRTILYLNRPLKFIELTSREKDVLSLDLKMEETLKQSYLTYLALKKQQQLLKK